MATRAGVSLPAECWDEFHDLLAKARAAQDEVLASDGGPPLVTCEGDREAMVPD